MPDFLPPRPRYQKERALYAYPICAAFVMLFALRLLDRFHVLTLGSLWHTLALQAIVFFLPALIFIRMRGRGYTRVLRLRRPYAAHIPLLIAAFFTLFSGALLLSILFGGMDSLGGGTTAFEQGAQLSPWRLLLAIPVVAVLPALLEELLFRGVLCAELDRRGALRTVLVSALLFALIHFDLANLPVYFFAGALFALVLYATDSLIATMLLHAAYNLLSLLAQRYLAAFYHFTGSVELFLFVFIIVFLLSALVFTKQCAKLYRVREENGLRAPRRDIPRTVQLYTMIDAFCEWPVVLCILLSVVGFILF